jgi:hypothetical protein
MVKHLLLMIRVGNSKILIVIVLNYSFKMRRIGLGVSRRGRLIVEIVLIRGNLSLCCYKR